MKKYLAIFILLAGVGLAEKSEAAVFYVDFQCGTDNTCSNVGTATTTPFGNLDAFTEVARSAGDIAFLRRGVASTTGVSDLNFTSDGTIANPIIISADYDNLWNDFATSSQTYSVAVATSTFYASGTVTGIAVGDWVYVAGDCFEKYNSTSLNQCEFANEVASTTVNSITFYLPYKGNQSGSALDLRVMPDNPQWNAATGNFQWNFDTDDYWIVKGLDIRGTDANGNVELDSSIGHMFFDTIFIANGSGDFSIARTDDTFVFFVIKSRFSNYATAIGTFGTDIYGSYYVSDSFFQGGAAATVGVGAGAVTVGLNNLIVTDSVFLKHSTSDIGSPSAG